MLPRKKNESFRNDIKWEALFIKSFENKEYLGNVAIKGEAFHAPFSKTIEVIFEYPRSLHSVFDMHMICDDKDATVIYVYPSQEKQQQHPKQVLIEEHIVQMIHNYSKKTHKIMSGASVRNH